MFKTVNTLLSHISSKPVLWRGGGTVVLWYGVFVGAAYACAGLAVLWYISHQSPNLVPDYAKLLCYFALPGAIGGARFFSWALEDGFNPRLIFRPGFWWHGGLAGLILSIGLGCTSLSLSSIPLADGLGFAMPVFEVFNRLGCLSYGCCWGGVAASSTQLKVCFTNEDSCIHRKKSDLRSKHLYPVQIYAVVLSLMQILGMLWMYQTYGKSIPSGGFFATTMVGCAIVRLICEHFRADYRGSGALSCWAFAVYQAAFGLLFMITINQLISFGYIEQNEPTLWMQKNSIDRVLPIFCREELIVAFALGFGAYGVQSDWNNVKGKVL